MPPSASDAPIALIAPIDRFWLPTDRMYGLDQSGWLLDRSDLPFYSMNPDMVQTAELSSKPCLVLLGEPGMGKSTTVHPQSPLLPPDVDAQTLYFDLASYSSEARLVSRVLEGKEITAWVEGTRNLCLTLDSFDEAHTRIENLHQLLAEYLDQWECSRLLLRIVSRTAEWPASLEESLKKHYEDVVPYELLPLRRRDAGTLASSYGIDAEAFLTSVEGAQAVPLASRPLTLGLLAKTYRREGSLPRKSVDLYEKGLLGLCEEMNVARRDASGASNYNGPLRLETASRLAALSIFGSRPTFWMGPSVEAESDDLTVAECSGYSGTGGAASAMLATEVVKDALQTGLFTGSGSRRLTWAHATFADFLASRWVVTQALNETKIRSLLISGTGRLYPRVRQIAAWLVAASSEFAWLIEVDPEAFLLNVEIADDALRTRIVSAVLTEAENGRMHYDYHKNLSGLSHPELADQIHSALQSPTYDVARIAIDIARQCRLQEASSDLVAIALNEKAELGLRVPAAWSVYELGKDNPDDSVLPLLHAPLAEEDDIPQSQELMAAALMASWPHAITTVEVFKLLDPQHRKNFIGIYSMAIAELARSLNANDLQPAL